MTSHYYKILNKAIILTVLLISFAIPSHSAEVDRIYKKNIKTVKLYAFGNQLGYPIINLNSSDQLELHFDDTDGDIKNYYYTFQLCNADWTPAILSSFDFIRGFSQSRITTYRISSVALTRYTHYQAVLPERNSVPTRSGNYILKVYLNGDTSKMAFSKRFLVLDNKMPIGAQVQQPFNTNLFYTHQKVMAMVNTMEFDIINPRIQTSLVTLQNNIWETAVRLNNPTFIKKGSLEYNSENDLVFPAGKEWRWLDLRSLRFQSDRIDTAIYYDDHTDIFLRKDISRKDLRYNYYSDLNGMYSIETTESINPFWQGDYAKVRFSYAPTGEKKLENQKVYVFGELTNYEIRDEYALNFNEEKLLYEGDLFLKQGFYNYSYVIKDIGKAGNNFLVNETEGNFHNTENTYMVLFYYRPLGGRADELLGMIKINSVFARPGGINY